MYRWSVPLRRCTTTCTSAWRRSTAQWTVNRNRRSSATRPPRHSTALPTHVPSPGPALPPEVKNTLPLPPDISNRMVVCPDEANGLAALGPDRVPGPVPCSEPGAEWFLGGFIPARPPISAFMSCITGSPPPGPAKPGKGACSGSPSSGPPPAKGSTWKLRGSSST